MDDIRENTEEVLVGFGHLDNVGAGFSVVLDELIVRLAFYAGAIANTILESGVITTRSDEENLIGRDSR